jgi:hypothetical protein
LAAAQECCDWSTNSFQQEKPAGVNRRAWRDKKLQLRIDPILRVRMWLLQALRMSPFEMAVFIVPSSLIIAHLRGPSGMPSTEAKDLAMASLVQAVVAADAGLIASTTVTIGATN